MNVNEIGWLAVAGLAFAAAVLLCVSGALWLREHGMLPLWRFALLRRRPLAELALVAVFVGGFVHYGASKGMRSADGSVAGAAREDTRPPERTAGGGELRFVAIAPGAAGVALSIEMPAGGVTGNALDLFCTTNLLTSWALLGEVLVGASVPTADVFVASAEMPGAPSAMPSAAFFLAGTHDDADCDGLYDGRELRLYGTDPLRPDTDGDGLTDGYEVAVGTAPLSRDTDGDGYPDDEEVVASTNPRSPNPGAAATIRYFYDDDDRLLAAYAGAGGGSSVTGWSPSGDPVNMSERGTAE